jgi:hypothetical protein
MKRVGGRLFREVWLVDFEFCASEGERPIPICLVGWELSTGRKTWLRQEQLVKLHSAPYPTDRDCLMVAYYGSAEIGCHLALGWPIPTNLLDLFVEFRNLTNGRPTLCGNGLLGALAWFGLPAIEAAQKDSMRSLALRGGPWNSEEQTALLEYCESDVSALSHLLPAMEPDLDIERALLKAAALTPAIPRPASPARANQTKPFLRGPVPLLWLQHAARLPGKALQVGIALWFRRGIEGNVSIKLSNALLRVFGVDRHAKGRALRQLESHGLIAVSRKPGSSPAVTILQASQ